VVVWSWPKCREEAFGGHAIHIDNTSILVCASQQVNKFFFSNIKKNMKRDFKCIGSGSRARPNATRSSGRAKLNSLESGSIDLSSYQNNTKNIK
jgi:hypothetical protein